MLYTFHIERLFLHSISPRLFVLLLLLMLLLVYLYSLFNCSYSSSILKYDFDVHICGIQTNNITFVYCTHYASFVILQATVTHILFICRTVNDINQCESIVSVAQNTYGNFFPYFKLLSAIFLWIFLPIFYVKLLGSLFFFAFPAHANLQ